MTRKTIAQTVTLLIVVCFSAMAIPTSNGQTIIEDGNLSLSSTSIGSSLNILRDPDDTGDNTGVVFEAFPPAQASTGFTIANVLVTLDLPGGDWYLAQPGQVFSSTTIAAEQFDPIAVVTGVYSASSDIQDYSGPLQVPSRQFFEETELSNFVDSSSGADATQFYIAVATRSRNDTPNYDLGFSQRNIFGWALIEVGVDFSDGSQSIELLDSAVAFDAGNIIVGQNAVAAVPEPCSGIVLARDCFSRLAGARGCCSTTLSLNGRGH